jgi:hypothetical protein
MSSCGFNVDTTEDEIFDMPRQTPIGMTIKLPSGSSTRERERERERERRRMQQWSYIDQDHDATHNQLM